MMMMMMMMMMILVSSTELFAWVDCCSYFNFFADFLTGQITFHDHIILFVFVLPKAKWQACLLVYNCDSCPMLDSGT